MARKALSVQADTDQSHSTRGPATGQEPETNSPKAVGPETAESLRSPLPHTGVSHAPRAKPRKLGPQNVRGHNPKPESLLEIDASPAIATSGLRTTRLLQEPPFRKPPHSIFPTKEGAPESQKRARKGSECQILGSFSAPAQGQQLQPKRTSDATSSGRLCCRGSATEKVL